MAMWNPWRGCRKYSEGCKYCYIHKGDSKRGIVTDNIIKTAHFYAPVAKNKSGTYKIRPGQTVYLCFSTDFLKNIICQPLIGEIDLSGYILLFMQIEKENYESN